MSFTPKLKVFYYLRQVIFLLIIGLQLGGCRSKSENKSHITEKHNPNFKKHKNNHNNYKNKDFKGKENNKEIPSKVLIVRDFVRKNGEAMQDYVGGRTFKNLEQLLPKKDSNGNKINYHEWDVNPKINGKNRGRERLITGSDGKDYFTNNHYKSFIQLKLQ